MPAHPIPVFDLGGVFIDWNPLYLFRKMFETEEEAVWFHTNICTLEWNLEFDSGTFFSEGISQLITRYPKYWRQIQAYNTRWEEMIDSLLEGMIGIHDEIIAAGIPSYAITKFSIEKWISMLGKWSFLSKFDGVVVSGLEKMVKPDPRLYQIFCTRYNIKPQECVFIDDNAANIQSARAFGMQVIHFTSPETLRNELVALGFPLRPTS